MKPRQQGKQAYLRDTSYGTSDELVDKGKRLLGG